MYMDYLPYVHGLPTYVRHVSSIERSQLTLHMISPYYNSIYVRHIAFFTVLSQSGN